MFFWEFGLLILGIGDNFLTIRYNDFVFRQLNANNSLSEVEELFLYFM